MKKRLRIWRHSGSFRKVEKTKKKKSSRKQTRRNPKTRKKFSKEVSKVKQRRAYGGCLGT